MRCVAIARAVTDASAAVCYCVLRCGALCCSADRSGQYKWCSVFVLQCVALWCNVLQCVAVSMAVADGSDAVCCSVVHVVHRGALRCSALQCVAVPMAVVHLMIERTHSRCKHLNGE